ELEPWNYVVLEGGGYSKELIVLPLTLDVFDPDADLISGTAPAGELVRVDVWVDEFDNASIEVIAVDGEGEVGNWVADFNTLDPDGYDVIDNAWYVAFITDENGDSTMAELSPVQIILAAINRGVEAYDFGPGGTSARLEVHAEDGSGLKCEGNFNLPVEYNIWLDCVEVQPGDQALLFVNEEQVKDHAVFDLTLDEVDLGQGYFAGTAPPWSTVHVSICNPEQECFFAEDNTEDSTIWAISIDPTSIDPQAWFAAVMFEEDGDHTVAELPPPPQLPFFEANITHEWIDFFEFPPEETIHVSILFSDGSSFNADVTTDGGGYSHLELWDLDEEINPGDVIEATATGVKKALRLVDLTLDLLSIDAGDAHLEGTAPDGLPVFVVICNPPPDEFTEPDCIVGDAIHPPGIDWWIDFSPDFEIFPEADAWVYIFDLDGDATMAVLDDEPAPQASFIVFPEYDFVQGFGWQEGEEVTLIVDTDTDPDNGYLLLTTGIATLGEWGVSVDFNLEIDIQPGYRVVMFGGDFFKMHDVTDISVTAINPDNDTVSGTAFPGSGVNLWVHGQPGTDITTSADDDGNWVGPFTYDLVPGTGGIAAQFDNEGDGTFVEWLVVSPEWIIEEIERFVNEGNIAPQMENSLLSKLKNAIKSLEKGNENAAIGQLEAFINQVDAQSGKKISEEIADMLILYSQNLIQQISMD
ncbi:MAG: hypothetical protein ABUK16_08395, partial [Anaerolineales bacterium]